MASLTLLDLPKRVGARLWGQRWAAAAVAAAAMLALMLRFAAAAADAGAIDIVVVAAAAAALATAVVVVTGSFAAATVAVVPVALQLTEVLPLLQSLTTLLCMCKQCVRAWGVVGRCLSA